MRWVGDREGQAVQGVTSLIPMWFGKAKLANVLDANEKQLRKSKWQRDVPNSSRK